MLRRDTTKFLHGGELCVSTYASLKWMKVKRYSEFFDAVPVALKSVALRWYWLRNRAIRYQPLQNWFITLSIMFELLSRNLMCTVLRRWSRSLVRAVRQSLLKMTKLLSQKPPNAHRIFWAVRLNDGPWKNCVNTFFRKRFFPRYVLKRFVRFCTKGKSSSGESRRGKNATIRDWRLKKTDPKVCKQTCIQWPDRVIRRIWAVGNPPATRTGLVSQRPPETLARDIYSSSWRSALAGVLRCSSEKAVGLCSQEKTSSGSIECFETASQQISETAADSFNPGQLLAASKAKSATLLSQKQYPPDLDSDKCIMAQSYRMPVYACKGICNSWN